MTQTEHEAHEVEQTPEIQQPCMCQSYLRATEHAALRSARWLGRADQEKAEDAAAFGMRYSLDRLPKLREPQDGDVIVFEWPEDPTKNFVKRLVGLPGDTLEMREGKLIRNGRVLNEPYVVHTEPDIDPAPEDFRWQRGYLVQTANATVGYHPSRNNWGPLVVPVGNYFVLGDNRDNSLDSRYWGFVADSLVKGRPFVIYYSYAPDSVDFAWLTRIRWQRVGERVH